MAVPIDRACAIALIEEKFGSVDGLAAEWAARHDIAPRSVMRPRDRSTIYKWLDSGLPAKKEIVYSFCALLDVDPIGIMESSQQFVEAHFAKERRAFQMSDKSDTILAPFRNMYLPGWRWPSKSIASFYEREWTVANFAHEAEDILNVYAAIRLKTTAPLSDAHPRVFHFAYQQKNAIDRLWRPYGVIIALGERVRLIAESGNWQEADRGAGPETAIAETFFGPRPTLFRVASLHSFNFVFEAPTKAEGVVRFH